MIITLLYNNNDIIIIIIIIIIIMIVDIIVIIIIIIVVIIILCVGEFGSPHTPDLPAKIIPAKIRRLELSSGKSPMDTRIPQLKLKILLESNPLKSRVSVRRSPHNQPARGPLSRTASLQKPP